MATSRIQHPSKAATETNIQMAIQMTVVLFQAKALRDELPLSSYERQIEGGASQNMTSLRTTPYPQLFFRLR